MMRVELWLVVPEKPNGALLANTPVDLFYINQRARKAPERDWQIPQAKTMPLRGIASSRQS